MSLAVVTNPELKPLHTFGLAAKAKAMVEVHSVEELIKAYGLSEFAHRPKLVLGGGSNVVFTEDFTGLVIRNRIMGRQVEQTDEAYLLHLGAGEDWDSMIRWSLQSGYPGLENMALIPGTVGAAPIQNIGAYGVELADFCDYVEYLDLASMTVKRLPAAECQFGYRDSCFKQALLGQAVITAVGLKLPKEWQPRLSYGPLQQLPEATPDTIYQAVVDVRQSKLPDPCELGNAGSFFKNPVISANDYQALQQQCPDMPGYPDGQQVKVPAGWLIDRCGLKGHAVGDAAVHQHQALVLVNRGQATVQQLLQLATEVIAQVEQQFGIQLEPEVRLLDRQGKPGWHHD